jgi:hypothetical protein
MFNFLKETSKVSSTRVALFLGTVTACIISLGVLFHIIHCTIKECDIEWSGAALFISAISAFIGTLLYGKVQQKKIEVIKVDNKITKDKGAS